MARAGSSPSAGKGASVLTWLLPTLATAGAGAAAVADAPVHAHTPVAWCAGVATAVVAATTAEAARRGRALRSLRREQLAEKDQARRVIAEQEAFSETVAAKVVPEAVARIQRGEFVEDVLEDVLGRADEFPAEFRHSYSLMMRAVLEAVGNEEDLRESAQRAFVNVARRVQAIVHQQAQDLREMEDRHGSKPEVFGDLLHIDHGNALIGRLADSIAVLGGARPGRQWSRPVPLFSVLRGAMSRIMDYQRVELHSVAEVAVVGNAVEPLIHGLAELLDNATRYSPPQTRVHLTAVEVQTGIAVEIEDGGVSLSAEGRARAERMLREAQEGIDMKDLGETPRLGLAVVGRLSREYNFQVSLRSSAYGGVRAVLVVPQELITTKPATDRAHGIGAVSGPRQHTPSLMAQSLEAQRRSLGHLQGRDATARTYPSMTVPGREPASRPVRSATPGPTTVPRPLPGMDQEEAPAVTERTPTGLPQRRRRNASAAGAPQISADSAETTAEREAVQPGMWLAAFTDAVNGKVPGRADTEETASSGDSETDASSALDKGDQK